MVRATRCAHDHTVTLCAGDQKCGSCRKCSHQRKGWVMEGDTEEFILSPSNERLAIALFGGEGGIRTHGPFQDNGFRDLDGKQHVDDSDADSTHG